MDLFQMGLIISNQDSFWILIIVLPVLAAIFFLVLDNVARSCSRRHVKARFRKHYIQRMLCKK